MITSNVRIPEELWENIKKIAEKEKRSMNAQLIYILEKFSEQYEKEKNK